MSENPFEGRVEERKDEVLEGRKKLRKQEIKRSIIDILLDRDRKQTSKNLEISEILAQEFQEECRVYTSQIDEKNEMFYYNEGIYVPNGKAEIKKYVREMLGQSYTHSIVNLVIAKVEADTFINYEELFQEADTHLIAVQNGILDLNTNQILEFAPDYKFFTKINAYYDSKADCPKIKKFLSEVLADETTIDTFFEMAGWCLWREYVPEKAFMFWAKGRNGKGKTIGILKNFLGEKNCSAIGLQDLKEGDNFILQSMLGKLANMGGDLQDTTIKETATFKKLTGRDPVTFNRKFLIPLTNTFYTKQIFACNDLPRVWDNSLGFWERWELIKFPYTFIPEKDYNNLPEDQKEFFKIEDPNILEKITDQEELNGLLNEALKGLKRLRNNKKFSYSRHREETKQVWIRSSNTFMAFCLDNIKEDINAEISKLELKNAYIQYCRDNNVKSLSQKQITKYLLENYKCDEIQKYDQNDRSNSRFWTGICLKNNDENIHHRNHKENILYREIMNNENRVKTPVIPVMLLESDSNLRQKILEVFEKLDNRSKIVTEGELIKMFGDGVSDVLSQLNYEGFIFEARKGEWKLL